MHVAQTFLLAQPKPTYEYRAGESFASTMTTNAAAPPERTQLIYVPFQCVYT